MKIEEVKLLYSSSVHFAAAKKYPDGLFKELQKPSLESFEAVIWAFSECAKAAELWSRYLGNDPQPIRTEDEWKLMITPKQLHIATEMVYVAIMAGMNSDGADEAVDMTLLEFKKKLVQKE